MGSTPNSSSLPPWTSISPSAAKSAGDRLPTGVIGASAFIPILRTITPRRGPKSERPGNSSPSAIRGTSSSPQMLRIFPRKLGFNFRILLAPKAREVLRNLDRFHARRQDMHDHRHAAHRDLRRLVHIVKLLDPQRDV